MKKLSFIAIALVAVVALPLIALAQSQSPEQQKSIFLRWVEDRLSTPDRHISISNINGVLSSDASIDEITVSDKEGVYLKIENAAINWNQAALLTGRLEINSLTAQSIDYLRNPVASPPSGPKLPKPEAQGLQIPELPVAVIVKKLTVPRVTFGQQVFGLGSAISLDGSLTLEGGSLTSNLTIDRLDGPGGTLALKADYDKPTSRLDVDLTLDEPPDGIIANLLHIEGHPAIRLNIAGSGPVSDLTTKLTLAADGRQALAGTVRIEKGADGYNFDADLGGPIATLIAPDYRPFFGGETKASAKGLVRDGGGVAVDSFTLEGGALDLTGSASTSRDGFLDGLKVRAEIADPQGGRVVLPVPGGATGIDTARLAVEYGSGSGEWQAALEVEGFRNRTLAAQHLIVKGSGVAAELDDPQARRLTFNADGNLSGVTAPDEAVAAALGDAIDFGLAGKWSAGSPIDLAQFRLIGKALSLEAAGQLQGAEFDGTIGVKTANIAPFSGVAGRDLSGGLDLAAKGKISPLSGGFDLDLDGTGTDLHISDAVADRLLAGTVRLTGGLARTEQGVTARAFRIANRQVQLQADGRFASDAADFRFDLALADLKLLSDKAEGALSVQGTARGSAGKIGLDLTARVPRGALLGRTLADARFAFAGTLDQGALTGKLDGTGSLDGQPVRLASTIASKDGTNTLSGLEFTAGGTRLTGSVTGRAGGLYQGKLTLASSDLSTAAALMLVPARGAAEATIALTPASGKQNATVTADLRSVTFGDIRVGSARIDLRAADLFGVPVVDGTLDGGAIHAAGLDVETLKAVASRTGETTKFDAKARLSTGTDLAVAGALAPERAGYRLALDRLDLDQGAVKARLVAPVTLSVEGGSVTLSRIGLAVGDGTLTASGTAGRALDLDVSLKSLPLSVANAVVPSLELSGTLAGTAHITGSASDPKADFNLTGSGLGAASIADFGVTPLSARAKGSYAGGTVRLSALSANSPAGLAITGSGNVPLSGAGLDLRLDGTAPLALANRLLAGRGAQASGTLKLSARVTGSFGKPNLSGRASVAGGTYTDPGASIRLVDITGDATLSGDRVNIDRLTAALSTGGKVSASGSVSLGPGYPADLTIRLDQARYVQEALFVATLSGDLHLSGPVATGPTLGGTIRIARADISVPERLGGGAADIRVRHVDLPRPVAQTLARARVDLGRGGGRAASPYALKLDLTVTAPNQIFVRGRGLDVEAGGSVRLTGTTASVVPVGAFRLIRGRLSILGERVVFDSGTVTMTGNLDPEIDLSGTIRSSDITVTVSVSGRATDPDITFTSSPALPQDEVLSRLLFKQGIDQLSPLQLAKLAAAASSLAGGGNSDLLDSLRQATGLDDLDIITDAEGNTAVRASRYLQDNIYLSVQADAKGRSRASVNLDITPSLKASASTGTNGESDIGIMFEQDY